LAEKNNWRIPGRNDKQIYINDKQILFFVFNYVIPGSVLRPNVDYSLGHEKRSDGKKYIQCVSPRLISVWDYYVN